MTLLGNSTRYGGWAEPEEIADAICYLCSDGASFVTGSDLRGRRWLQRHGPRSPRAALRENSPVIDS